MPLKTFKPITPSGRYKELPSFDEITKSKPEKSLLTPLKRSGGRNNTGRITTRHIGGGHKRHYRLVDFKRNKRNVEATGGRHRIRSEPHLPHRPDPIQGRREILHPRSGRTRRSAPRSSPVKTSRQRSATRCHFRKVPLGTEIHNIELLPGGGGKVARSAGQSAILSNRDGGWALVKMRSGEIRRFHEGCYCTIGVGRQPRPHERSFRKSRPHTLAGSPSDRPRHVHEPRRSPERWW